MNKTNQGLVIGLASALIGVLYTLGPPTAARAAGGLTVIGRATVVQCNR
ncbi:hypothetical protein ACPPVO_52660 [Dactylosporangium sp. McL0621]